MVAPIMHRPPPQFEQAPPRRLRLGTQLLLGLAAVTAIIALTAGLLIRDTEHNYLTSFLAQEHQKKFELLLYSTLDDMISEDVPRLETTMKLLIRRDPDLYSARILNESGTALFTWQRDDRETAGKLFSFGRDVVYRGERFGRISVSWDASPADRQVNQQALFIAIAVGIICALLSSVIYFLTYGLAILPINRISSRLLEFRRGVFDGITPLPPFVSTEFDRLNDSMNALGEFLALKQRREAELRDAKDAAESANRAKTEFLANVSHELRTPLNAINGFSEMMKMQVFGPLGDRRYGEYAESIHLSGKHLLSLINDILDISKVEAGQAQLQLEDVDLAELIRISITMVEERAARGRIRIIARLPDDLPPLRADGRKLQQILLNLLSNAIKFTSGGGKITISVSWHASFGAIVKIADTGIGIPEEKLDLVLEPFGQVENPLSRQHDGVGLGLPLAKMLVELHGGTFQLESRVGVGTEVSFSLPSSLFIDRRFGSGSSTPQPPAHGKAKPLASKRQALDLASGLRSIFYSFGPVTKLH